MHEVELLVFDVITLKILLLLLISRNKSTVVISFIVKFYTVDCGKQGNGRDQRLISYLSAKH